MAITRLLFNVHGLRALHNKCNPLPIFFFNLTNTNIILLGVRISNVPLPKYFPDYATVVVRNNPYVKPSAHHRIGEINVDMLFYLDANLVRKVRNKSNIVKIKHA